MHWIGLHQQLDSSLFTIHTPLTDYQCQLPWIFSVGYWHYFTFSTWYFCIFVQHQFLRKIIVSALLANGLRWVGGKRLQTLKCVYTNLCGSWSSCKCLYVRHNCFKLKLMYECVKHVISKCFSATIADT